MVSLIFSCHHRKSVYHDKTGLSWRISSGDSLLVVLFEIKISWLHILRKYRDWVSTLYGRLAVWPRFPGFLPTVMG
jgi:hypothetical protein